MVDEMDKRNCTLKILSTFGGTMAGESAAAIPVNSSEKLLTSSSSMMRGTNGAATFFLAMSSQFSVWDPQRPPPKKNLTLSDSEVRKASMK